MEKNVLNDEEFLSVSKELMTAAARISAPLWWVGPDENGKTAPHNGTAFFLRTENALFGITAAHVIEGDHSWRWYCDRYGFTPLKLTGWNSVTLEINWNARRIDLDLAIDIATFSVTDSEITKLGLHTFKDKSEPWPAKVGEWVSYCGFPGLAVREAPPGETTFGANTATGRLTTVGDRTLNVQIERHELEPAMGQGLPPENFNFGGISGGPVFRNFVATNKEPWCVLGGVIIQGRGAPDSSGQFIEGFELVTARRAAFINPEGTLDLARWDSLP